MELVVAVVNGADDIGPLSGIEDYAPWISEAPVKLTV